MSSSLAWSRRFGRSSLLALWGLLACGCAATKPKAKASSDFLPLIDAHKMKKIEVIHVAPADPDKPEGTLVATGREVQLDDDDDVRQLDAAKLADANGKLPDANGKLADANGKLPHANGKLPDANGDPKGAPADPLAAKKTSTTYVGDNDSGQLPEPGSASSTAPESMPTSTDKAGKEAAPTKPAGSVVVVTMPGFRVFSDGSSRVYVHVSGRAKIVEKKDKGKLRYHLSGVTVPERVNRMALPTGHFGTPVAKAFVTQVEGGADLVIVLRETVKGVVRLKKRGRGVVLSVDFPKQRKKAEEEKDPLADAG